MRFLLTLLLLGALVTLAVPTHAATALCPNLTFSPCVEEETNLDDTDCDGIADDYDLCECDNTNTCLQCTPESNTVFCQRLQKTCGTVTGTDNCGNSRTVNSCGTCVTGQSCTAQNRCTNSCVAESDAAFCQRASSICGQTSGTDNCGVARTANCGTCATGRTCTAQHHCAVNNGVCGYPPLCVEPGTNLDDSDCDEIADDYDKCPCDPTNQCLAQPSYTIDKSVASHGPFTNGQLVTYTITLRNQNNANGAFTLNDTISATGFIAVSGQQIVFDPASQRVSGIAGTTTVTGTIDQPSGVRVTNLHQSDGPLTVTYRGRVVTTNLFTNAVTITNVARIMGGAQDSDYVTITGSTPGSPLTVSKAVSNTAPVNNEIITYTITVRNPNSVTVPAATVYDSIGDNLGVLTGNRGGTITFLGTETVTATAGGSPYTQAYTGSIASAAGLTLQNIPANALVTVRYQARVSMSGIGSGITSTVSNTATVAGATAATTRVTLRGSVVPPDTPGQNDPPFILPIPNQPSVCGAGFPTLDLDDFIGDPETPNDQLLVSVDGNRIFQARVDPVTHVLTVTDPTGTQNNVQENIRITVRDPQGRTATRTIIFSVIKNTFGTPIISGIPDQIIKRGKDFETFDLDDYTSIGGNAVPAGSFDYYVTGSSLFAVTIDSNNQVEIEYDEDLFRFTDADQLSEQLTFTIRGCSEAKDTAVFSVVTNYPTDPVYTDYEASGTRTRVCTLVPEPGVRLPDKDCDGVPDGNDNCLDVVNPDQTDKNKNGVGDVCDIIASCTPLVSTDLAGGKTLSVTVAAQNNAGVTTTTTKYAASIEKLGLRDVRTLGGLAPDDGGEATLKLRIPDCVTSGSYVLTCSVQAAGHTAETKIPLDIKAGTCHSPEGDSSATIFSMQDVLAGSEYGASFPIVIKNDDAVQRSYVMSIDGIVPWGDYVFESGGVVVVPAGASTTTNLRVYAYEETIPGEYPFKVIVKSGDDLQETYLKANVEGSDVFPAERNGVKLTDLVWLGLLVIVLGLILWGAYAAGKAKR